MPRQRSLSATRTVTSTVNFVGRIGQSLRISSKNAIKRFDSTDTPPPPPSSWRARLDRSKSAVCQRTFPSESFESCDSILLAAGTAIEAGLGEDENCTAGELVEYQPGSHALISSQRSFYSSSNKSAPSSCPGTPQMVRRKYMKEGATQLTSLSTLITHHRYLFLFNDLLLISKQKGANSYKLKQKISLDRLWISSNNCTHSFLIGWPLCNYVAHFNSEEEKNEWFEKLSDCINRRFKPKSTTVTVAVKIEGRQQNIRKEIQNNQTASDLLADLIRELDLSPADSLLYELVFEPNSSASGHQLHGIENIYAILMDHIIQSGIQLSETQMAHLDTCPLVHCRLVLRNAATSRPNTAMTLMSQVLKVLSRSQSKCLFGKELEGSMPPQPVLTMIDHLMIHGAHVEGILRKSPKQATVRLLKTQLDNGQVPDFHQFNVHVTASLLKEYLRGIPGQLLLSGNYHLWMEVCDEKDENKKIKHCKNLLKLLPQCHTVLLKSVLRLLRKIASNENSSKMNINSLGVCIAPSLLENPNIVDSARKVPDLAIFLISHASELFEGFDEEGNGALLMNKNNPDSNQPLRLHQSTDSGLSGDEPADLIARSSISPDSALFDSPISEGSVDDDSKHEGPRIEEIETIPSPSKEKTPVLSRENSDAYNFPHRYQWRSHLSAETTSVAPRLMRQEAFRQVVSTQSSISSQDNEDLHPLEEEIRVLRIPPSPMDSLPNVDDLRISDIIISHRKKESSDSTKTLIGRTDSNGFSSKSSEYSGKLSNIGSLDGRSSLSSVGSPYISSLSSSSSSGFSNRNESNANYPEKVTVPVILQSPKNNVRKQLLTKSETLGIQQDPKGAVTATAVLTPLHRTHRMASTLGGIPTPTLGSASTRGNMLSMGGSLDRPASRPVEPPAAPRLLHRVPLTRDSAVHPSLDRKSVPYRPPKRTAEEIVLDTSLEVNWSVPQIRSFFQTKDSKPAKIDTVYATLDSLKKPLDRGGHLSTVNDEFANNFLAHTAITAFPHSLDFWIGANNLKPFSGASGCSNPWIWTKQNSIVDYSNWGVNEPSPGGNCVSMNIQGAFWIANNCNGNKPYVCEIPATIGYCEEGWAYNEKTGFCYRFMAVSAGSRSAEEHCVEFNSHLVSIHDDAENNFVGTLASMNLQTTRDHSAVVKTKFGALRGFRQEVNKIGVYSFFGVPYAKAPIGPLRFRPPEMVEPWDGVLQAKNLSKTCYYTIDTVFPQFPGAEMWNPPNAQDEDCLGLNIWVPENHDGTVMVWIFGGGFFSGSPSLDLYDGRTLSTSEKTIVININYRLGAFGFLYLGDDSSITGNMGLLDQQLALRWIYENIHSFGGDPSKITLFGESAGGASATSHLFAPGSAKYFSKIICNSGVITNNWATKPKETMRTLSMKLVSKVNCLPRGFDLDDKNSVLLPEDLKAIADCISTVPAQKLQKEADSMVEMLHAMAFAFVPISEDKHFFQGNLFEKIKNKNFKKNISAILGTVKDEGTYWLPYYLDRTGFSFNHTISAEDQINKALINMQQYENSFDRFMPYFSDSLLIRYALLNAYQKYSQTPQEAEKLRDGVARFVGDFFFTCNLLEFADLLADNIYGSVYVYFFNTRSTANPWPKWMGVMHGYEIEYIFGMPFRVPHVYEKSKLVLEQKFSKKIMKFWKNFAKYGIPVDAWPKYNRITQKSFVLDEKITETDNGDIVTEDKIHGVQCNLLREAKSYKNTAEKMDDIPMADASDNETQGGFTIRNVLTTPMSLDPRFQTDSSDESSASGSSSFASCPCSSEPEPEILSAKFFNNGFLESYYPNIDFSTDIVPTHWSVVDRHPNLFISPDRRIAKYLGRGENPKDASAVRANAPIPRGCGVFYFEIHVMSRAKPSLLGIGICDKSVPLSRLPGWDPNSYGYHGDDGLFFAQSGKGTTYGPTFEKNDIIGCGLNFANRRLFFTKNGQHLGYLDYEIPIEYEFYPVIGMQAIGEVASANFGQSPFVFDIFEEQQAAQEIVKRSYLNLELPPEKILWMNGAVRNWLNHVGYSETAINFSKSINVDILGSKESMEKRHKFVQAIKEARLVFVIEEMEKEFSDLFNNNKELWLLLRLQRFIDRNYWSQKIINGELPMPVPPDVPGSSRVATRSSQRKNSTPRSGMKRKNNDSNPRNSRNSRNSVSSENGEAMDVTNGHSKNGCDTTTIVMERQESLESANGDAEMQDVSESSNPRRTQLFDRQLYEMYKFYEPTIYDARQIMDLLKKIGPVSAGIHDLAMRTLDMLSCKYDGLPSSRTPITEIMSAINHMSPELSRYSVGGTGYSNIDKVIFGEESESSSPSIEDSEGENEFESLGK
ncbi:hypothetical protein FO519_005557 [Halicephalobus sp. NKZ332]|nr:hypothetical protein FO519_005557 [Halicephalobus sp. NKZ332]